MTYDVDATRFWIMTSWRARREDPASIANRLRRFLDMLAGVDETLVPWSLGKRQHVTYDSVRTDLASLVERDVKHDEMGEIDVRDGYSIIAWTSDERQRYSLVGTAGCDYGDTTSFPNGLMFKTNNLDGTNLAVVSYGLMKAVMLAMIACWDLEFCVTRSSDLQPDYDNLGEFAEAWMTYVPPAHAASIDLVGVPFSEWTPDGGLLLSAATEIFSPASATHMQGAHAISRALQHLNATLPG